ncbi:GPI-anchored cell surface glycoprotein, partial [Aspergillus sp. HF37]
MSLNGLEDPIVAEAYQSALTDAGGWLLLRYVSRDELTLLDRGAGGVPELRNAIDGYEDTAPLYGFLQYRRRKVVISYMPQGLSRLVQ